MDYYTKWPEAFPIFSKCTEEVVDNLHKLICRYGVFSTIISDQGGEFNSKLVEQFSSKFGIKHITTSPYHPQANGMIEKFNSTLKSMLNKCIDEHGHQWHNYIDISLFAYRTSQHHSTKVSPFFALYIRQPVLVNQQDIAPMENDSSVDYENIEPTIEALKSTRSDVENKMKENIIIAQAKQKQSYDKRHKIDNNVFENGEKVLLKNFRRKKGLCEQKKYLGPYTIYQQTGKGCYKIMDDNNKILGPYNCKSLKRFYTEDTESEKCDDNDTIEQIEMTDENNNEKSSSTDTANSETECDSDDLFITQNKFTSTCRDNLSDEQNESMTDLFGLNESVSFGAEGYNITNFDIGVEEMIKPITTQEHSSRPKRQRKMKQSSIYEYYGNYH